MAEQVNLFGHSIKPKRTQLEAVETNKNESFEERERRIASEYGRRHIGYPCDEAQDLHIDDRHEHIFNKDGTYKCEKCKKLMDKLEKEIGLK